MHFKKGGTYRPEWGLAKERLDRIQRLYHCLAIGPLDVGLLRLQKCFRPRSSALLLLGLPTASTFNTVLRPFGYPSA